MSIFVLTPGPWRWSIMRRAQMELSSSAKRCPTLAHFLHHHQLQSPVTWKLVRMSSIFYKWGVVTGVADLFFPLAQLLYAWVGLPATTAGWSGGSRSKYVIIHAEKSAPFTGGLRDCSEVLRLTEVSVCSSQTTTSSHYQDKWVHRVKKLSGSHFFWSITIRPPLILCKVCVDTSCFLTGCSHISPRLKHTL